MHNLDDCIGGMDIMKLNIPLPSHGLPATAGEVGGAGGGRGEKPPARLVLW